MLWKVLSQKGCICEILKLNLYRVYTFRPILSRYPTWLRCSVNVKLFATINLWELHINKTKHVFVKHGCPRRQQSLNMAISQSPTFWPRPTPRGMSVKCEEPKDELTVQVWLLYDHPNFKYCTLFVSGTELRTNVQTDGRTDRWSKH